MKTILMITAIVVTFGFSISKNSLKDNEWKAPPEADQLINPLKYNAASIEEAKKLYMQMCSCCHGDKCKGDGMAGISLTPKPANFTSQKVQNQTDGALFWKLSEGRPPMAAYKGCLTSTQRWQLVNYLRTFKK